MVARVLLVEDDPALHTALLRALTRLGWEVEVCAGSLRAFGVGGECAADEFNLLINGRRDAMHPADERAASAADHAVTNFSAHINVCVK